MKPFLIVCATRQGRTRRIAEHVGATPKAFGAPRGGDSKGHADPELRVDYGYLRGRMAMHALGAPRNLALRDAVLRLRSTERSMP